MSREQCEIKRDAKLEASVIGSRNHFASILEECMDPYFFHHGGPILIQKATLLMRRRSTRARGDNKARTPVLGSTNNSKMCKIWYNNACQKYQNLNKFLWIL